jgi:hypothetical protein
MLFEHSRIFFVCLSVTHLRIDSQNMAIIQQPQNNQAHSPVSRAAKCGFPLSSTHALAIIVSRHERFCRFSINVIGLEEIDPLIFSIRDSHFRKPFSPLYSVTDSITVGSEQEPTMPPTRLP